MEVKTHRYLADKLNKLQVLGITTARIAGEVHEQDGDFPF